MDDLSPSASAGAIHVAAVQWAPPHGQLRTWCLVALNVLVVLLIYLYLWRIFSRKGAAAESTDVSSPAVSPRPKARNRRELERAITALPGFVHSSDHGHGAEDQAVECAICIAEFSDGEEGRLLPRCGHRFHARCVAMWFRFHTTCPLCRRSALETTESKSQQLDLAATNTVCPI